MSHFREGEKVYGLTRIFNLVIKLFIICSSDCTSCSERSCPWVNIRLYVCNSNHYVFFIIRKRYSLTYIFPVVIAGYIFARFIIPSDYLQAFSYVSYIIVAGKLLFVCFELFLLYKIVRMLPTIRKNIKNIKVSILHFLMQLMQRLTPL